MPELANPRHERFCQLIVAGESQSEAYRVAYSYTGDNANVLGPRCQHLPAVEGRISELRATVAGKAFLSLVEKRQFLAQVVRMPAGMIDETSPLCQAVKVRADGAREIKMPNKLQALELDAKLAGEFVTRLEVSGSIKHVLTADERARRLEQIIEKRAKAREIETITGLRPQQTDADRKSKRASQ